MLYSISKFFLRLFASAACGYASFKVVFALLEPLAITERGYAAFGGEWLAGIVAGYFAFWAVFLNWNKAIAMIREKSAKAQDKKDIEKSLKGR